MKEIRHIKIKKWMKVGELVEGFSNLGFVAREVANASEIFKRMIKDKDCTKFFGLAGAMVPAGMKEIIIDMLRNKAIDVLVTTGANLTHDLIESLGHKHYQGSGKVDDRELHKKKIDRIYDVYMSDVVYQDLERCFIKIFDKLPKECSIKEFIWEVGKNVPSADSILKTCYKLKIPIFCPALSDSGIGLMVWGRLAAGKKIRVDAFDDLKEMMRSAWDAKKSGVFYVGGGVPKNFIQQAMQFSPKGADYGIQITTDIPYFGGSSGAELREGISWGKLSERAVCADVRCDATIALPLIWAAVKEKL